MLKLPLDLFLAFRYLRPKRTFVSVITLLSILGPLLGVAILIIVRSVMAGFDKDIRENIMNMQAHLCVYTTDRCNYFRDPMPIIDALESEGYGIKAAPIIESTALIQLKNRVFPKVIRGIDPEREAHVTRIQANFSEPGLKLAEHQAVIGRRLASHLGLAIGNDFLIHSPSRLTNNVHWKEDGQIEVSEPDEFYLPEQVTIVSYYSMGIADYDDNIIVMHIDQAADLLGLDWGNATSIQCSVPNPLQMNSMMADLRTKYPDLIFITWQENNEMLFSTLQVEQTLMTFLMAFIILVASFSIASTLITVVVQKTREIGILKAVGVSNGAIARLFLFQGGIIGVIGTGLGAIAGLLVLHYRDAIARLISFILGHDVFPPELYHLTTIPALTDPLDLAVIIAGSVAICIAAALFPAIYASAFSPATSLKSDN